MTNPSRWWFAAFTVVVFLAGTSVGVIVDRTWLLRGQVGGVLPARADGGPRIAAGPADADRAVDVNVRRLRDRLNLTPEQEAAARTIIQGWLARVRVMQQSTRQQLVNEAAQLETALAELSPPLSPAQREQLTSLRGALVLPAPARGRGRFGGPDGRGGLGREGPARPGGSGRE